MFWLFVSQDSVSYLIIFLPSKLHKRVTAGCRDAYQGDVVTSQSYHSLGLFYYEGLWMVI